MLFRLFHQYVFSNGAVDENQIGIYTEYQAAREAIEVYKSLEGFRDFPDGFHIERLELETTEPCVYCLYYGCEGRDECWELYLGCFGAEAEARRAILDRAAHRPFCLENKQFSIRKVALNVGDYADGIEYVDE